MIFSQNVIRMGNWLLLLYS